MVLKLVLNVLIEHTDKLAEHCTPFNTWEYMSVLPQIFKKEFLYFLKL